MPPSKGRMKCNIDAAFREGGRRMGIGACLRDDRGHCVHAFTTLKPYLPTMKEDEALAILHTLEYLKNNGFHDTLIWWKLPVRWWLETFSVGTMTIWNLAASLINKCRRFLLDILNVSIGFIRRQANSVAHSLAKDDFYELNLWYDIWFKISAPCTRVSYYGHIPDLHLCVCDVLTNGKWDLNRLKMMIPRDVRAKIKTIVPCLHSSLPNIVYLKLGIASWNWVWKASIAHIFAHNATPP
ncbi:hypothetical protein JHK82_042358 [Glycine max]|uniref:RNase H type-1 domain-containing protein n=1 Tax=Glycine soja TaxID=3848 RepID=A0A0B2Q3N8_GLYSO|nr:hypothetical protein JHK86_042400 [Glycine max]KAG5105388.1 hypothetical protein JHK82_042358 [Glycine max]KAG5116515.1 hypothetical protein JHK84_042628 [Glycine max]KHN14619.1 hypothetical protein glysoja_024714 [Glycine soja]